MVENALANRIAGDVAQAISAGEIRVGAHINTQVMVERFAVSRTPIRNALAILSELGLVEHKPHLGYFVPRTLSKAHRQAVVRALEVADGPPAYYRLAEDWVRDAVPAHVTERMLRDRYALTRTKTLSIMSRGVEEGWIEEKSGHGWRLLDVAKTPEALEQVYRFRLIVEPAGFLEPGFQPDRPALHRLRTLLTAMRDGAARDWPPNRLWAVGVDFHEELVRMSGNTVFHRSLQRANGLRRLLEFRSMVSRDRVHEEACEHLEILDMVSDADLPAVSARMRHHLEAALARKRAVHDRPSGQ